MHLTAGSSILDRQDLPGIAHGGKQVFDDSINKLKK
jgi:hypothetical protein